MSLLARCPAPAGLGRVNLMDRRGDGVPIILRESLELSGRRPEYMLIDESEIRARHMGSGIGVGDQKEQAMRGRYTRRRRPPVAGHGRRRQSRSHHRPFRSSPGGRSLPC